MQEVKAARVDDAWSQRLATIQQESGLSSEGLIRALAALADIEVGLLVYLDDAESLMHEPAHGTDIGAWRDDSMADFWRTLVALAKPHGSFGVLVSSRIRPEGTPDVALLTLEPMSR
jgi:hypothetical protein